MSTAETREAMLAAAKDLFLRKEWVATTIADIAAAARVSKETVYAVFGTKKALLQELIARAVHGAEPETPLVQQDKTLGIAQDTDQARQIALFAAAIAGVLARVAPLVDVVRAAAETDQALAALYQELQRGRLDNLEWFAKALRRNGALRDDMEPGAAGRVEGASQETYAE